MSVCYFLATLSSLADHKDLIGTLFETKEYNKSEVYLVKFYINGYLTPVVVNERVPARTLKDGSEATAFAGRPDGQLWVSILEKAWAKLHGTYARAEIGFVPDAFSHLTGVPCKQYNHVSIRDRNEWWETLKKYSGMNYIMMSSSKEANTANGISPAHAYTLLSYVELASNKKVVKLLKLRNPWGHGIWTGDWSNKSPLWTDALRKMHNV